MKATVRRICSTAFLTIFFGSGSPVVDRAVAQASHATSCSAAEYRQFDFWVGDWDAFEIENPTTTVAHIRVTKILDGCVLLEDYEGSNGSHGESFSIYDASRKVWHQTWATNRGALLWIEGVMQADGMVLSGVDRTADGKERQVRGVWKAVTEGVRETAVMSTDGGKKWNPWFDLIFRLHRNAASLHDADEKAIAALDTQYQAAVHNNDWATMDCILADDFIIFTGSGKTYNKADEIDEAKSGRVLYEHQEDTQQSVRIFGDSAVVTARLWAKGTDSGKPFDYRVWFSDVYVRTPAGWRYTFAQSSLPLPINAK